MNIQDTLEKYYSNLNSDDIILKEQIKDILFKEDDPLTNVLMYLLNNDKYDKDCDPSEYYNTNIIPYYIVDPTQVKVKNYVCFELGSAVDPRNNVNKYVDIQFHVMCGVGNNNIVENTSFCRHDIISAIIIDKFNFYPMKGGKFVLKSNIPIVTDKKYAGRTIIFEQFTDNNIQKNHALMNKVFY